MKALEILKNDNVFDEEYLSWNKIDISGAISELEQAMKPKTCEGCKWEQETKLITTKVGDKVDICKLCTRYENLQDHYEPNVTP